MKQNLVKGKILVVDDNAENRALAQATLEDEGYQVVLGVNGEDGIRAFEAEDPDCVLLDVGMPDMDGFAVYAHIRGLPHGADTPIIFLTASRDVETFDRSLQVGAADFLTKPIQPTELSIRIESALKLQRMSADLREQYEVVRRQRDDLLRLHLQKERLSAFIVHDLKNPVNSMDLHAQLLLRSSELPERARKSVECIREEVRSLLRLILNLLDISKSEEGQLTPRLEHVDLDALVAEVQEAQDVKARRASVTMRRMIEASALLADVDLLRRVLENLLDNAIRHAPEKTEIHLSTIKRNGTVEIRIADSGPGISPAMREKIFERFVQVEAGERVVARMSRGLGLAFCKVAVEAHGGNIWVEEGSPGAVFCVRFPAGASQ